MGLTEQEREYLSRQLMEFKAVHNVQRMKLYYVHGGSNVYDHSLQVVHLSYWLGRRLHLRLDNRSMVRGAFLHDFYLYDWHYEGPRMHGFRHPAIALENALQEFELNAKEQNIIASHMWPLTLRKVPRSREAALVSLADKLCALHEDFVHHVLRRRPVPVFD